MKIRIVYLLASILASSTDLKSIQTPHSLLWDFGADKTFKTRCSGARVLVQVRAPASHLAITPEGCSSNQSKVLTANQWPSSWGSAPTQLRLVGWQVNLKNTYCCALYNFRSLDFHQCLFHADRLLTLNMNILLSMS